LGVSQLLICTYPHAALGFARFCKTDAVFVAGRRITASWIVWSLRGCAWSSGTLAVAHWNVAGATSAGQAVHVSGGMIVVSVCAPQPLKISIDAQASESRPESVMGTSCRA
ncbi:hypothetical protein, partial [Caballeronia terrestris]|uniref:hypothetical protein n=1 Tax=Caballeronia terrestris TaxID=1226301 RepID=UPI001F421FE2